MCTSIDSYLIEVFNALEIDLEAQADPILLADILKNDMYLDDFLPLGKLLEGVLQQKEISFKPMLEKISKALQKKHPAIVEFLCAAHQQQLFPKIDTEVRNMITRTLHHVYLLNKITSRMSVDPDFMEQIVAHLRAKRKLFGIRSGLFNSIKDVKRITGEWFSPAKTVTMDIGMNIVMAARKKTMALLVHQALKRNSLGVIINILEAVSADVVRGFYANGLAGIALTINPIKTSKITSDTHFIQYTMSQDWASLYETWNLAFVTGNINNLNLIYPKLLIPVLLDAEPADYLMIRIESLWLTINFQLFAQGRRQETRVINGVTTTVPAQKINRVMPNKDSLARLWGDINLKYAKDFIKMQIPWPRKIHQTN